MARKKDWNLLQKFASRLGGTVFALGGIPLIGGKAGYVMAAPNPSCLIFAVDCVDSDVADTVERSVAGILVPIPEGRWTTRHGYTQIKFEFDPENAEAVRAVRKLKEESGKVLTPVAAQAGKS
jgi:hypothetical protein